MSLYTQKILSEPTLLAYWPLNDLSSPLVDIKRNSGASQVPITPGGTTLQYHSASPLAQGQDAGLQLVSNPGSSPYVIALNTDTPTSSITSWAMEVWCKWSDNSVNRSGLLFYLGDSSSNGYGFYHGASGGGPGKLIQGLFGGITFVGSSTFQPVAGTSYYLVLQRTGGTATLYVNNVSQATTTTAPNGAPTRTVFLNESTGSGPEPLVTMAHAAVYSAALTATQMAEHYAVGSVVDPQRLFGEGYGS